MSAARAEVGTPAGDDEREPRPEAFREGRTLDGKYLLDRTIAEGGMGVIVAATHVGIGQRVAIKYLKPRALADRTLVERFAREARLAAQISSEHVVRVQDVGVADGAGPYMVMEHLVGRDLGSILEEGPLPVARAVDYLLQACDALAEAHALGIVHRDVKPENMFLAQRPSNTAILKIIDFGVSKVAPKRGERGNWATETAGHHRVGTPLYMSPEQLRTPAEVDHRTDIWALGAVLFELLTASPVFEAPDLPELCTRILHGAPRRARDVVPDVPEALERVIARCLEKSPANRFRNVAELVQELLPFGPTDATSRIARIRHVVRRGGSSVRPPTPGAFSPQAVAITLGGPPAPRDLPAPSPAPAGSASPRRLAAIVAASGIVITGLALVVAGALSPRAPRAGDVAAAGAAASGAVVTVPEPPVLEPDRGEGQPIARLAPVPSGGFPPTPSPSDGKRAVKQAAPPPPSGAAAASAGIDRRAAFGDRK